MLAGVAGIGAAGAISAFATGELCFLPMGLGLAGFAAMACSKGLEYTLKGVPGDSDYDEHF